MREGTLCLAAVPETLSFGEGKVVFADVLSWAIPRQLGSCSVEIFAYCR